MSSAPRGPWQPSTLSHISGKDRRYSPIADRTINRRLKKFAVGRALETLENPHEEPEERNTSTAGILRSPTASQASSPSGAAGETAYGQLETGRPIRLEAPVFMDVPDRVPLPPLDASVLQRLFSPAAHRDRKRGVTYVSGPDLRSQLTDSTDDFGFKSKMSDAQMLATASRRAGDARGEGLGFFRLALLQDNLSDYGNAVKAYKKYLKVSERVEDASGAALALNCIGVNLHLMAEQENDPERKERLLRNAALYHERHFESGDTRSQFVAKINGGLVLAEQGDHTGAIASFQDALKYALILKAPREQAIAFGNLAMSSYKLGLLDKAQRFLDQQLSMLEEIGDALDEAARSHLLLGRCAAHNEEYKEAQRHSEQAMKLADEAGSRGLAMVAKCFYGANLARSMYEEVVHDTAKQMVQR